MAVVYDNWERLVRATLRREQLWESGLRTPSDVSLASSLSASSSFNFTSPSTQDSSSNLLAGKSFTYHQILQATDHLSKSNFIKHGRSGDLFYGVLEDGLQVVVKKIDQSLLSYSLSELEFLGKVSHSRFVPFLGHCLENGNYKFLVYKYMLNKDLSSYLNNREIVSDDVNADCQIPTSLDWAMRLKIAIGVAQGLCYLHHECVPPLVHRNVEPRSILIDENFEARIGRLTQVCTEKKDRNQKRISRLLWLPKGIKGGTSGEYATCAYDVYCFGKVLLELVTDHPCFGDHNDSRTKGSMENVLPYITTYYKELFVNIMDPSLVVDEHLLIEVWAVAVLAKACLNPKPSKRPQMSNILEALEHPGLIRFSTHVSLRLADQLGTVGLPLAKTTVPEGISGEAGTSQTNANATCSDSSIGLWNSLISASSRSEESYPNRVIWDLPNLRIYSFSELKTATKNFRNDRVMGEDAFGRVYKGWLHVKSTSNSGSQSLVAIKRLSSGSMQGFHEWETEIRILGMLSHPNLIKLHGYCWKDEELLLVYEYMQKGSLDNHLFGRGSSSQPLQWDVRLKILIGAARALAFLHALEKQVIYRDAIMTSSILIDGSYNAKLSNFGLAKMGPSDGQSHVTTRVMGTGGYAAPEYIATGHLYVKSDVFNFGVALAEVLTGLRYWDLNRMRGKHNLVDWIEPVLSDERKIKSIMDSHLEGKYPIKAAIKMAQLARTCLDSDHKARPSMKEVVDALQHIKSAYWIADGTKDKYISYPLPEPA